MWFVETIALFVSAKNNVICNTNKMALIIDEESILNNLPIELNQYQLLIFDSICTTLLMIQNDFNSLECILENYNHSKNNQLESVKNFIFVWGIIDKNHRLVKIYQKITSENN